MKNKKLTLINILGASGTGKSVLAAQIFAYLKIKGLNAELVLETCKDLIYETIYDRIAEDDPFYLGALQSRRFTRLFDSNVDVAVTDGSLFIYAYWAKRNGQKELFDLEVSEACRYDNKIIYVSRGDFDYKSEGRVETEEESNHVAIDMKSMLDDIGVEYVEMTNNTPDNDSIDLSAEIKEWLNKIIEEKKSEGAL